MVSARAAVSVYGVSGGVHLQAVPGNTHAHAHWRAPLRVRCVLQTLHAEIYTQHSQAHPHRYEVSWRRATGALICINAFCDVILLA